LHCPVVRLEPRRLRGAHDESAEWRCCPPCGGSSTSRMSRRCSSPPSPGAAQLVGYDRSSEDLLRRVVPARLGALRALRRRPRPVRKFRLLGRSASHCRLRAQGARAHTLDVRRPHLPTHPPHNGHARRSTGRG
jgi:hypothetical protein